MRGLATVRAVPGRMERIGAFGIDAIVDYAHTPDALANVLHAARETTRGRLIVVFGCGGDRDAGKRVEMGKIAAEAADAVIVTTDNPRGESPAEIASAVADGIVAEVILDRRTAIRRAINDARAGDTVVVAGKGHEAYQIIGDERCSTIATKCAARSRCVPERCAHEVATNDALAALAGTIVNRDHMPATIAVSTDTRDIRPSETFLALRGERYDGHTFVADAAAAGASVAIVDDASALPEGLAGIVVADTLAAYLALGALARDRVRGPVIAITGSTGKTTTKTFAVQALEAAGKPVTATPENENNEIGVAKFLLSLDDGDERIAIVEFGARKYRDLEPLVLAARPDIGVLTNIGEAHLEIMGSRERLAETKWGLFAGGAQPVLNLSG